MDFDLALIGGGLQNGLISLAVLHRRPGTRIALVERAERLGGSHTWCFFAGDLDAAAMAWTGPLVVARWPEHEVRFPRLRRVLTRPYAAISAARLHAVVTGRLALAPGCELLLGRTATAVDGHRVRLDDGRELSAGLVVEALGPEAAPSPGGTGHQKFLGQEVRLARPMDGWRPIVMDATVEQVDGYRFVYALPLAPDRMLVEDTVFSEDAELNEQVARLRLADWLAEQDLEPTTVLREERGVLPMPWTAPERPPSRDSQRTPGPLRAGIQGGWFHPGTGYSLPVAARLAALLARHAPRPPPRQELAALWDRIQRQARFARMLNRLLFGLIPPAARWRIFERFYRLPQATIGRFYALDMNLADQARILLDHPPGLRDWRLPALEA